MKALWLTNRGKPTLMGNAGMRSPSGSMSTSVQKPSEIMGRYQSVLKVETSSKFCEDGPVAQAVEAMNLMVRRGCRIPGHLFYRVLKSCIAQRDLVLGRRIHALTVQSGYDGDAFLATHLIGLYASHGRLDEAIRVFSKVPQPSVYNWASIIFAYARHGESKKAIGLYRQMRESAVKPDNRIFVAVLKACASAGDLDIGKGVHAHIRNSEVKPDLFVETCLVHMYVKCGSLKDAQMVFDGLPQRDVVTWTTMIAGYTQQGMGRTALSLYRTMQQEGITPPDSFLFVCLLQACGIVGCAALPQGKQLHAQIEERGLHLGMVAGASLVNMYAKCGSVEEARRVFDRLPDKGVVTWNVMIAGYAQEGMGQEALHLYSSMQQEGLTHPSSVTFVCLLQACAAVGVAALHQGQQLHAQIERLGQQTDLNIGNSLVNMYTKCGSLEIARSTFDGLPQKNVVTWTTMIAGYAQQGIGQEALCLYSRMQQECGTAPNSVTFVCVLQACAAVGRAAMHQGKQLHAEIHERGLQDDVVVAASLINMYGKCGSLEDARRIFDRLHYKDVVTWTAMITGYAHQGKVQEALCLYGSMQQESISAPNSVTFVCLLQACASVAALPLGKELHAQIDERGLQADVVVGSSLVCMYAKCGSLKDAQQVFDSLAERNIVVWGALIAGYARQGDSELVFALVDRMMQEGMQLNGITFLSVLTLCSHVGLIDEGRKYFQAMRTDYGITPSIEHYTCMMDILGRAGNLDEALEMVKTMPFQPDGAVWLSLLGASRKWNNVEVGRQAFEFAVSLNEKDSAAYDLMSNIYACAQMWEEEKDIEARRLKCGAWKEPGQSWWIGIDSVVHTFVVGERSIQRLNIQAAWLE